ncbi:MAG: hypothetical protein ABSA42_11795 [Terracidiphilus sp.]|jgi:hypothetical protein
MHEVQESARESKDLRLFLGHFPSTIVSWSVTGNGEIALFSNAGIAKSNRRSIVAALLRMTTDESW